jgi:hypothetical protein
LESRESSNSPFRKQKHPKSHRFTGSEVRALASLEGWPQAQS